MFKNFEGDFAIDPNFPGLRELALLTASDNRNVASGASRSMVYALKLVSDPRFELIAVGERYENSVGKSDIDLKFRHRETGRLGHAEFKEWSPESQKANLSKANAKSE